MCRFGYGAVENSSPEFIESSELPLIATVLTAAYSFCSATQLHDVTDAMLDSWSSVPGGTVCAKLVINMQVRSRPCVTRAF